MKMNRREFLYAVGSATTGIAGWVLIPGYSSPHSQKEQADIDFCPRLAKDISFRRMRGGGEFVRSDELGAPSVVCYINACGLKVIEELNGEQTVQDLAEKIHEGFNPAKLEQTEASVASFLALLAQAGLLAEPFFVNLHAVEVTG